VVSLVPGLTEVIFALGAGDAVVGVTTHDTWPPEASAKPVVGGFWAPSHERISALSPDLVLVSDRHREVADRLGTAPYPLAIFTPPTLAGSLETIRKLGTLFGKPAAAQALIESIGADLDLIRRKTATIDPGQRLRVMRLMGRNAVMTPGDDSFQNEMISAAGALPPRLGKTGPVVPVTLDEWQRFDPQVLYGCGGDRQAAERLLNRPGWRDVSAVRNQRIYFFPCALTCRAATGTGRFVAWLSSRLYSGHFADPSRQIRSDQVIGRQPVSLNLGYVDQAAIVASRILDFVHKTLVVDFNGPTTVVSTLSGTRRVRTVGNHYLPPPSWSLGHGGRIDPLRRRVCAAVGRDPDHSAFLFTGADMDHLAVQQRRFRDMAVTALVTAGVTGNAVRMSRDTGAYYEPGTINIILLPNMRLSDRAMTRAIISATEAKSAALLDLDIRSSYQPGRYRATGTGTDNIIVAQGAGQAIDNAGGHSKMGELNRQGRLWRRAGSGVAAERAGRGPAYIPAAQGAAAGGPRPIGGRSLRLRHDARRIGRRG
jgi:iron complex transport system substrate-binding protein